MFPIRRFLAILFLLAAMLLISSSLSSGLEAAPLFPNPVFQVGTNPYSLVSADFDGDGKPDLVNLNYANSDYDPFYTISLLKGMGDGSFTTQPDLVIFSRPIKLHVASLNSDNLPDLIVEHQGSLGVLLNQGNWSFSAETDVTGSVVPGYPDYTDVGDYTGDGRVDILVWGSQTFNGPWLFQLLVGGSNGSFTASTPVPAPTLQTLAGTDVNHDGLRDVVVAPFYGYDIHTNDLRVLLGAGDGTFQEAAVFDTGAYAFNIVPLQLNADTNVDLLVSSMHFESGGFYGGPNSIFYGTGDGHFTAGPVENTPEAALRAADGDFNHDGLIDYVAIQSYDDAVVYFGQAGGGFARQPPIYCGASSISLALGDWNQDSLQDLAVLSNWAEAVFTYQGNPDGTFGPAMIPALRDAMFAAAGAADFNGDGHADLAVGRVDGTDVSLLLGNGDGSFGEEVRYPAAFSPNALIATDLDADALPDIAVVTRNWEGSFPDPPPPGTLALLHGNGDGTLAPPNLLETDPNPLHLAGNDVNRDGNLDLLVLTQGQSWFGIPAGVQVFAGQGNGSFTLLGTANAGLWASDFAVGDIDGDGNLDLAVGHNGSYSDVFPNPHLPGDVSIMLGNGDGTFQSPVAVGSIFSASDVELRDLNGDSRLDLVVANEGTLIPQEPGGVEVLLALPGGGFAAPVHYDAGVGPLDLRMADFDRDGFVDAVTANNAGDEALLRGRGDGTFEAPQRFALMGGATFVVEEDVNGDGREDLLVGSVSGVFALLNQSAPAATRTQVLEPVVTKNKKNRVLTWSTDAETDVAGFNVVVQTAGHRTQINGALLACEQCTSGAGADYSFSSSRFGSGSNVFVEVVYRNGDHESFGPADLKRTNGTQTRGEPTDAPGRGGR